MREQSKGFTLMEFLAVLGIIGILIALLFPVLMNARERARIARARGEVMALQQAWQTYWQTYGEFPWAGEQDMHSDKVEILGGENAALNPRRIAFMEFDRRHYAEGFLDPWKRPYKVELRREPMAVGTTWSYHTRAFCGNAARDRY